MAVSSTVRRGAKDFLSDGEKRCWVTDFTRILVTGGAGFIGSAFVRRAVRAHPHWRIVVLDKLTYAGNLANLAPVAEQITFHHGDITEPADVQAAMAGADAVINFAAESHVDRALVDPRPCIRTNIEGVLVLLEIAQRSGVRRFLQVSSDEIYGDFCDIDRHAREDDALAPRNPYAASKAGSEHLAFSYAASYGLDVVVTRGANTYGPYQYPEKIIPLFITNALQDQPLPLYGDGMAVRDYLYVEDHAAGIDLVLHHGAAGTAYNLGARTAVTGVAVAAYILEALGKPRSLMQYIADRPGHDYRYSVDPSRAEALGWTRAWDFVRGMAQTVAWYVAHADWWRAARAQTAFREHETLWYAR